MDFLIKGLAIDAMFAFDTYKNYDRGKQNICRISGKFDGTYTKFGEDSEISMNFSTWSSDYYLLLTVWRLELQNSFDKHDLAIDAKFDMSRRNVSGNNVDYNTQDVFGRITTDSTTDTLQNLDGRTADLKILPKPFHFYPVAPGLGYFQ